MHRSTPNFASAATQPNATPLPLCAITRLTRGFTGAGLAGVFFLCAVTASHAELVYRPNEGWKQEGGGLFGLLAIGKSSNSTAKTADLQLERADELVKKNKLSEACAALRELLNAFPHAQQTAEARLRLGELLERRGKFEEAFETFDQLLVKNPESKQFTAALDAMFAIGKRYMNGEKRRLFGVRTFSSNRRAEEMFDTILKRAPYARSAPQVMLFRGMVLERQGKDAEALAAYQQIIERFPSDSVADDAQYQMGYIRLRNVKTGSYDSVDRVRAQESFEDYLNRAPQNGKVPQARENLQLLESNRRKAALDAAKFYEKTGKTKSAAIYYRDILKSHPGTEEATFAKKRLETLKAELGADAVETQREAIDDAQKAQSRKEMQSKVNTVSRPDYVGPKLKPDQKETKPSGSKLQLRPDDDLSAPPQTDGSLGGQLQLQVPAPRLTPPSPQNP
jgi:outer membrane protein assembly factor BamD